MERPHGRDALNKCCIECVHVVSVVVMHVMRILLLRKGVLMNVYVQFCLVERGRPKARVSYSQRGARLSYRYSYYLGCHIRPIQRQKEWVHPAGWLC